MKDVIRCSEVFKLRLVEEVAAGKYRVRKLRHMAMQITFSPFCQSPVLLNSRNV
jgi:hypothetical protein